MIADLSLKKKDEPFLCKSSKYFEIEPVDGCKLAKHWPMENIGLPFQFEPPYHVSQALYNSIHAEIRYQS